MEGRATLIQSVTQSIPVYTMHTTYLPTRVCNYFDKLNRDFLWLLCWNRLLTNANEQRLRRHLCQIGTFSRCNQSLERLEHVFKQCPRAHQHINLIKGVSTPLKYLEVLKAHFSFKFPIARTNCWAKVSLVQISFPFHSQSKDCNKSFPNLVSMGTYGTDARPVDRTKISRSRCTRFQWLFRKSNSPFHRILAPALNGDD
ncbi:hypothetical protein VNO77_50006 [Canavalia gladiata]|uniref:Reverse transcriptase zinc-binding domain-containing protein n=1 Tax=Canavalia gladiata TaxID=3824 RepID=A0AAN9PFE9_CANGL